MNMQRKFFKFILLGVIAALLLGVSAASAAANVHTYSGTIASGPQYDLYTESLNAGSIVTATIHCAPPPNNTLDSILTVYLPGVDPSTTANAFIYNDDGGPDSCGGFRDSTFNFVAPQTGTYTFRVDGFGSATGAYTLIISIDPANNPMLADGRINGQQAATTILYCDGTTVNGFTVDGAPLFSVANGDSASGAGWTIAPTADGRMLFTGSFPDGKPYYFVYDGCPHGHFDALSGTPPQENLTPATINAARQR